MHTLLGTEDFSCRICYGVGDIEKLIICSVCGDHYHGPCVALPQLPGARTGWQCKSCRSCQICRVPDATEGRSLACEQCQKLYHAHCLRPIMTSIPKYGWKCRVSFVTQIQLRIDNVMASFPLNITVLSSLLRLWFSNTWSWNIFEMA